MSLRSLRKTTANTMKRPSRPYRQGGSTIQETQSTRRRISPWLTASTARACATECRTPSSAKPFSLSVAMSICGRRSRRISPCASCSSTIFVTRPSRPAKSSMSGCAAAAPRSIAIPSRATTDSFRCFDPKGRRESSKGRRGELGQQRRDQRRRHPRADPGAPVTSLYGMRFHPILHILRMHAGIDFGAPVGSEVRAAADGNRRIRRSGRRLRQPRQNQTCRFRDVLFASLRDLPNPSSRARRQTGRCHRPFGQHRLVDGTASAFRILPQRRCGRSPAASRRRNPDGRGDAGGSGLRRGCRGRRLVSGRERRARSPPFRR